LTDYKTIFNDYRAKIDSALYQYLQEQTKRSYFSDKQYPHTLFDPLNYIMDGSGKRIRPLILLICCDIFGGSDKNAVYAAIAIEILHNFTLVHDDIMDNADTRRSKVTIHKKWDINTAILVGDELIGLSYRSLLKTKSNRLDEIVKAFTDGVIEVCEGQALDKEYETSSNVTLDDYMNMIKKKTAELLRISALIGCLIADAGEKELSAINCYAENLGLAFQIQDDLLDVIADEEKFGKKIGGDILEKKKTYLYLKALELSGDDERNELKELYCMDDKASKKIEDVIKIYRKLNVEDYAKRDMENYTEKANNCLAVIDNIEGKNKLNYFSNILLNRNY
jgi:geranylgeranyl diphosphate synthase, type II